MVAPDGIDTMQAMGTWHEQHDGQWLETVPPGDIDYAKRWLLRQIDLVTKYKPDFCYFDNYELPFGPIGLAAVADYYNRSIGWHGKIDVVATAKQLHPYARFGLVQDVERGFSDRLWDEPWQTDTCLGDWFYRRSLYTDKAYRSADDVLQRLADVISKNGNLLLSVPQRGDGTIDSEEEKILDDLAAWMAVNGEAVFGTRPWRSYGEGPTQLASGMQNEGAFKGFTAQDVRFTTKGDTLYLFFLKAPTAPVTVKALGLKAGRVARARLLGGADVAFRQSEAGLTVTLPKGLGTVPVVRIDGLRRA